MAAEALADGPFLNTGGQHLAGSDADGRIPSLYSSLSSSIQSLSSDGIS